ncbi:MAG: DUF2520 domain-containing protein [Bdellovibrionales bacterium]|nr:DUF2520 domain-containing protein [Bdellovibrionales bacterium]
MGQVPSNFDYLVIGGGRLAKHLSFYLKYCGHRILSWQRSHQTEKQLKNALRSAPVVLLAIKDNEIQNFFSEHQKPEQTWVHFSGAHHFEGLLGFHPLMTFSHQLYQPHYYNSISFVGCEAPEKFRELFPNWKNPYHQISLQNKALYHSLCVLTGNGTTVLWELAALEFEKIGIDPSALNPYLCQVAENLISNSEGRLTGPWFRDDFITVTKNTHALEGHDLLSIYNDLQKLALKVKPSEELKPREDFNDAEL